MWTRRNIFVLLSFKNWQRVPQNSYTRGGAKRIPPVLRSLVRLPLWRLPRCTGWWTGGQKTLRLQQTVRTDNMCSAVHKLSTMIDHPCVNYTVFIQLWVGFVVIQRLIPKQLLLFLWIFRVRRCIINEWYHKMNATGKVFLDAAYKDIILIQVL